MKDIYNLRKAITDKITIFNCILGRKKLCQKYEMGKKCIHKRDQIESMICCIFHEFCKTDNENNNEHDVG